jgi:hypothetical protein
VQNAENRKKKFAIPLLAMEQSKFIVSEADRFKMTPIIQPGKFCLLSIMTVTRFEKTNREVAHFLGFLASCHDLE